MAKDAGGWLSAIVRSSVKRLPLFAVCLKLLALVCPCPEVLGGFSMLSQWVRENTVIGCSPTEIQSWLLVFGLCMTQLIRSSFEAI